MTDKQIKKKFEKKVICCHTCKHSYNMEGVMSGSPYNCKIFSICIPSNRDIHMYKETTYNGEKWKSAIEGNSYIHWVCKEAERIMNKLEDKLFEI